MPRKPTGRPQGRPEHEPNDVYRRLVTLGMGCRMDMNDIAASIGISIVTLKKYYAEEVAAGKAMTDMLVADKMIQNIVKGDTALIKFYMINQMGFKEKTEVENRVSSPEIPVFLQEFRRIVNLANARARTLDAAPPVQDGLVLSADESPATE